MFIFVAFLEDYIMCHVLMCEFCLILLFGFVFSINIRNEKKKAERIIDKRIFTYVAYSSE